MALYVWSHQAWLQAENYAENVTHTSLMYQTGMGAVAYMTPRVGMNWGAGGAAQMQEFELLQTARAWAVVGATGSMYDGAHSMSMMHQAVGGASEASGVVGEGTGWTDSPLSSPLSSEGDGANGLLGCGESFAAGTLVATPAGATQSTRGNTRSSSGNTSGSGTSGGGGGGDSTSSGSLQERPISSLRVGDLVLAYDPATQTTSVQTVQHVFIDHDSDLLDVTLRSSTSASTNMRPSRAKDEVVHTTASHPWLTADRGWQQAGALRVGEAVVTADGSPAVVVGLRMVPGAADMWDLTVSNVHTFVVGTGEYVVHNCGGTIPDSAIIARGGQSPVPPPGEVFSGAQGQAVEEAGQGVVHGQFRWTTAGDIRAGGGTVNPAPEMNPGVGQINYQHLDVCLGEGGCQWSDLVPNVPKNLRFGGMDYPFYDGYLEWGP